MVVRVGIGVAVGVGVDVGAKVGTRGWSVPGMTSNSTVTVLSEFMVTVFVLIAVAGVISASVHALTR